MSIHRVTNCKDCPGNTTATTQPPVSISLQVCVLSKDDSRRVLSTEAIAKGEIPDWCPLEHEDMTLTRKAPGERLLELAEKDPERVMQVFDEMAEEGERSKNIEAMSDAEVFGVVDQFRAGISMNEAQFTLLASISGRLRRANLGPYRQCSWCEQEATTCIADGPDEGQWWCQCKNRPERT